MGHSFLTNDELDLVGFKRLGRNVSISRKSSFYLPHMIEIGDNVRVDDYCVISGGAGLQIGCNVHVGAFSAIYGGAGVTLGDFSGLSARVSIYSESDDYSGDYMTNPTVPRQYRQCHSAPVAIGRHAVVGVNATVMPGVIIGEGAAVGAHSFVTQSCDPWTIYFGSPARKLKQRSRRLLSLEQALWSSRQEH